MDANGERAGRRQEQRLLWLKNQVRDRLLDDFYSSNAVSDKLAVVEEGIRAGKITVSNGVQQLLSSFRGIED